MRFTLILLTLLIMSVDLIAQAQALNAAVDYTNDSGEQISRAFSAMMEYQERLSNRKNFRVTFKTPVQPEDYHFNQAKTLLARAGLSKVNAAVDALRNRELDIITLCQKLDTYYKLEDDKKDDHATGLQVLKDAEGLFSNYRKARNDLSVAIHAAGSVARKGPPAFIQADSWMHDVIETERKLLDKFLFTIPSDHYQGFPVQELMASVEQNHGESDKTPKPVLSYPASSAWSSFAESRINFIEQKKRLINQWNAEARKSAKYPNEAYLDLINYFNGTLVADYNNFVNLSKGTYAGISQVKYVPAFRWSESTLKDDAPPIAFKYTSPPNLNFPSQAKPITRPSFDALQTHVEFVNETWRQVRYLILVLNSFSSTASSYRSLDTYEKRGKMHFDFKDFQVPLGSAITVRLKNKTLPAEVQPILMHHHAQLIDLLAEMELQCKGIDEQVETLAYERDHLDNIYERLERLHFLINSWDEVKEAYSVDVRKVYDAYPVANRSSSWYVSGSALYELMKLNHQALRDASAFYKGDASISVSTAPIEASLRDILANEYTNMKGIERIGRYNGLCPYTPYEDLPATARTYAEKLGQLKQPVNAQRHPYANLIYLYNEMVEDYNKFCELSKDAWLLPMVYQPEWLNSSDRSSAPRPNKPVVSGGSDNEPERHESPKSTGEKKDNGMAMRVDTVFVEKRDTVYIREGEDLSFNMEGYATNHLVMLLDVSGSMDAPDKLPLLKKAMRELAAIMRPEDRVSIITFSSKPKAVLKSVPFSSMADIEQVLSSLESSGKTDAPAAVELAYKIADKNYIRGGNNRVILATDGEFAVTEELLRLVEGFASQDILLSVFHFGKGETSRQLLALSQAGKGRFATMTKANTTVNLLREAKSRKKK